MKNSNLMFLILMLLFSLTQSCDIPVLNFRQSLTFRTEVADDYPANRYQTSIAVTEDHRIGILHASYNQTTSYCKFSEKSDQWSIHVAQSSPAINIYDYARLVSSSGDFIGGFMNTSIAENYAFLPAKKLQTLFSGSMNHYVGLTQWDNEIFLAIYTAQSLPESIFIYRYKSSSNSFVSMVSPATINMAQMKILVHNGTLYVLGNDGASMLLLTSFDLKLDVNDLVNVGNRSYSASPLTIISPDTSGAIVNGDLYILFSGEETPDNSIKIGRIPSISPSLTSNLTDVKTIYTGMGMNFVSDLKADSRNNLHFAMIHMDGLKWYLDYYYSSGGVWNHITIDQGEADPMFLPSPPSLALDNKSFVHIAYGAAYNKGLTGVLKYATNRPE